MNTKRFALAAAFGLVIISTFFAKCDHFSKGSDRVYLFSNVRRSGYTNNWYLSMKQIKTLPKWNPDKQALPLTLENALKMASEWVRKKRGGSAPQLESVTIKSINPDEEEFANTFYYVLIFGVSTFDRMGCIVLMDGTILEPD